MMLGGKKAPAITPAGAASRYTLPPSQAVKRHRWLVYSAAGIFCLLLFVLATLPAYWIDWLLNRAIPDRVRIQEATGTVWNGTGNLIVHSLGQELAQTRIAWSVQPWWLMTGKLQLRLNGLDSTAPQQAMLRLGYRYISIQDVNATVPAGLAAALHPAVTLVAPTGRLQIVTDEATLTPAGVQGKLQITWLGAGAGMGGLNELGDYQLLINGRGADAELSIQTLRGDVAVSAQGLWQTQGEGLVRLTGNVVPGSREQSLRPLLTMANTQYNNGQYTWTLNDRFPLARVFGAKP